VGRKTKHNPLELDFAPMTSVEVRAYRRSFWSSLRELARHPRWPCSHPSVADMARRFGVHEQAWLDWERDGVSGAWAALLRIYRDEQREVRPIDACIEELEGLKDLAGDWSELARWLDVDRRTISKWREAGAVPSRFGYGRLVKLCYEDMVG